MPALLILALSSILTHLYQNQMPELRVLVQSTRKMGVAEQVHAALKNTQKSVDYRTTVPPNAFREFDVLIKIPTQLSELLRGSTESDEKIEFIFYKFLDPFQKTFLMNEFVRILQGEVIREINNELSGQSGVANVKIVDPSLLVVESKKSGARDFPPISYSLVAWSLFAIFFIVIPFTNSFFRDWNNDILLRLKSLHVTKAQVLGGRILAYLCINYLQFFFLLLMGLFVFPFFLGAAIPFSWNSLGPTLLIVFASSLAATAYALCVSCLSQTQEQASSLGAFGVVIMSLLGGVMIPVIFMPPFMENYVAIFSPLYWALEGFAEAFQTQPDMQVLGTSLFVLLLFALFFYTLGLKSFKWEKR